MTDDRLRIWVNFWKWLIATVVVTGGVGLVTMLIDAKHRTTELQIDVDRREQEYLKSFLETAMDENLEKRYLFAQYFAHVATSKEYKQGWQRYYEVVGRERNEKLKEKDVIERGLPSKAGPELVRARRRLAALESQLATTRRPRPSPTYHPLNSFKALLEHEIDCDTGSALQVWHELVAVPHLPEFPEAARYITLGCRDQDSNVPGRFVAFYPDGKIIEDTIVDKRTTLFYPNGRKAVEGRRVGNRLVDPRSWSPSGDLVATEKLRVGRRTE